MLIVLVTKDNLIIVLLLSKVIFTGNMYRAAPGHSGTAGRPTKQLVPGFASGTRSYDTVPFRPTVQSRITATVN